MRLADFIRDNHEPILREWEAFARTLRPAAEGMSKAGLRDHADEILTATLSDMESLESVAEKSAKSRGHEPKATDEHPGALGQLHATLRIEAGFTLTQVVAEHRALRASILRLWAKPHPDTDGSLRFNEAIDAALAEAVDRFTEKTNQYREMVIAELEGSHPHAVIRYTSKGDLRGEWDSDRLAQVLSNLVGNALQHGDANQHISVLAQGHGEDITLTIHNAGSPIPAGALTRIFEPSVRNVQHPTNNPTGLGPGLYIAKELVTAHGGALSVVSTDADGTTFTVRLPRHPPVTSPGPVPH
jgi:signal transduction histidine kinase